MWLQIKKRVTKIWYSDYEKFDSFNKIKARERLYYESALNILLSLVVPKVSGDIQKPISTKGFQKIRKLTEKKIIYVLHKTYFMTGLRNHIDQEFHFLLILYYIYNLNLYLKLF